MTLHIHPEIEQGTEPWHDQRRGMVTASVVGKLLTVGSPGAIDYHCPNCSATEGQPCLSLSRKSATPIKTMHPERVKVAQQKAKSAPPVIEVATDDTSRALIAQLVAERITGYTDPTFMNDDMFRGVMDEPRARDLYSERYAPATEVGFMVRQELAWTLGYSPDGLVGDDGLLEVKSPRAKTHLRTILSGEVPAYHMPQIQAGLLVSGREWLDFISYSGGMPMFVKRVLPDQRWHEAIRNACIKFQQTATEMVAAYEQATTGLAQTERVDLLMEARI